ncbi:MAG: class I SAM-dependent DNA methyltransferase [Rhizobiales bacterium]|nr:class I SAM-dependent DNA methyltransferase [Hyphomicrobiales bacterium]
MRLSWNEIRTRAATFARDWAGEGYEKGQTQLFYRDFFDVFGVPVRRVASFEEPVKNLGDKRGFIDLFWKGVLLVEQKSAGRDLVKAKKQALDYFPGLKDADLPRYILVSDFQTFELYDLEEDDAVTFRLTDLPGNIEKLGFILGLQKRTFKDQDPVNIKASELVGKLHDALEVSGYTGHDLEQFLVRIVFCLFADDTGIFEPRDLFLDLLETRTREDGSDMGGWLAQLFQVLNTPEDRRAKNLDEDFARFPYVNGALFEGGLLIPSFDSDMRQRLIDASRFDWSGISPAIFGSLFQSVMNSAERRAAGAHYTTEKNILKVIQPLFLDELQAEFQRLKNRKDNSRRVELQRFQKRLGELTFFDPACGCGNFLIIAYRELRSLEMDVIRELRVNTTAEGQGELNASELSVVNVDQFYGIEIGEFPARIAETALWMMDHIMNSRLSLEFGQTYVRIPLRKSPHILHGDALEADWAALLPAEQCSYVFGNPPFIGQSYQSKAQRAQMARVIGAQSGKAGSLDYVGAWFIKAGEYVKGGAAGIGFVSTNSITQGEQVAQLWPILFDRCKLNIAFAHRTFAWGSDARGKAHVHVVIIGLVHAKAAPKVRRLFSYDDINGEPHESQHAAISPYLFDASNLANPHVVVRDAPSPLSPRSSMSYGSKPTDGGGLILSEEEKAEIIKAFPGAKDYIKPLIGAKDAINGTHRYCLWLVDAPPVFIKTTPPIYDRVLAVKAFRLASPKVPTQRDADRAWEFAEIRHTGESFIIIPRVSSERRDYVPLAFYDGGEVANDSCQFLANATLTDFALLTSAMHMSWLRSMGGRLESRYRYSIGLVYNTFPMPPASEADLQKLEPLAQAILDARASHAGATLADLYDPDLMPSNLRKAHQALDKAVDRLYRKTGFASDAERVEHLLMLYEKMVAPLTTPLKTRRKKKPARQSMIR